MKKIIFLLLFILAYTNASILFSCGIIRVPAKEGNACFKQSDYNSCKVIAKKYADNQSCYWDIMAFAKPPVETKYNKKNYKKSKRVTKRKRKHILKHKKYAKKRKQKSYKKKSRVVHKRVTKRKRKRYKQKKMKNIATNKVAKKPLSAKVAPLSKEKVTTDKSVESVSKKIEDKSDIDLTLIQETVKKNTKPKAKKKKVKTAVDTKSLNKFF